MDFPNARLCVFASLLLQNMELKNACALRKNVFIFLFKLKAPLNFLQSIAGGRTIRRPNFQSEAKLQVVLIVLNKSLSPQELTDHTPLESPGKLPTLPAHCYTADFSTQ